MVDLREIIPFYGPTFQVSELFELTQMVSPTRRWGDQQKAWKTDGFMRNLLKLDAKIGWEIHETICRWWENGMETWSIFEN